MKTQTAIVVAVALMTTVATVQAGPKWEMDDDSWMKLTFLGQVHGSYSDEASPETDVFLRRGRIILAGQVTDGVTFFAETDNDKAGKAGAGDVSTDIQDAFIDVRVLDSDHWVKAGLILLPFSFETRASAASLLGIDYNAEAIKLANTFVWRDYGAEVHGEFLDKRIAYAAGVFDGYDSSTSTKYEGADARVTGHIAVNLVGQAETGWFYSQNRLGKAGHYVSLGAGYDRQDKASLVAAVEDDPESMDAIVDSEAWVVDLQAGMEVGDVGVTVNGAWYDWDNAGFVGKTAFLETGLSYGQTMLTGKVALADPDGGEDIQDYTTGLHYFMKGHNVRGGVEYRWGDSDEQVLAGLQFLL